MPREITMTAGIVITVEPSSYGGRLKYFSRAADDAFWDDLWLHEEAEIDYSRYQAGHLPRFLKRTFIRHVQPGARVLEAGCGLGWFTVAANALGFKAEGVDYAPQVIAMLQARFPSINFFRGDVRKLSNIPDNTYDAIYSPGVCEHFEEGPEDVLREAYRLVKDGGIVLVSTPCFNAFRRFLHRLGAFQHAPEGAFYQYAFSQQEMTAILEGIGFDVLECDYRGTLFTLREHIPLISRLPLGHLGKPIAVALDAIPGINRWGQGCMWVARKSLRGDAAE